MCPFLRSHLLFYSILLFHWAPSHSASESEGSEVTHRSCHGYRRWSHTSHSMWWPALCRACRAPGQWTHTRSASSGASCSVETRCCVWWTLGRSQSLLQRDASTLSSSHREQHESLLGSAPWRALREKLFFMLMWKQIKGASKQIVTDKHSLRSNIN